MYQSLERSAEFLARSLALLGGIVLLFIVFVTCTSITGRSLGSLGLAQVTGDFEMVELGAGFAVFCFLAWTQFSGGHARVDMFAPMFGDRLNGILNLLSDLIISSAAVLLAWRLCLGMLDKYSYQETTLILQLPIWTAYLAGLIGSVGFALVSLFCVLRSVRAMTRPS